MSPRTPTVIAIAAVLALGALGAGVMATTGDHDSTVDMASGSMSGMAGSTDGAMDGHSMGADTAMAEMDADGVPFDQAFIDGMVPHHEDAVAMAEVARDRSSREEIKNLAGAIISAQEDEISQMKGWRQKWYGSAATPAEPSTGHGGMGGDLAAAADVDRAFLDEMVKHHESAIDMADQALERAEHPEIKALASSIRTAQRSEIDQMKQWHVEWYGS